MMTFLKVTATALCTMPLLYNGSHGSIRGSPCPDSGSADMMPVRFAFLLSISGWS
jgi:hypothetical protein